MSKPSRFLSVLVSASILLASPGPLATRAAAQAFQAAPVQAVPMLALPALNATAEKEAGSELPKDAPLGESLDALGASTLPGVHGTEAVSDKALEALAQRSAKTKKLAARGGATPESTKQGAAWDKSKAEAGTVAAEDGETVEGGPGAGDGGKAAAPIRILPHGPAVPAAPELSPVAKKGIIGGVIGLVVAGIILAIVLAYQGGKERDEMWKNSKSLENVVQVEKARQAKDAAELTRVMDEAYARRDAMAKRIDEAVARGEKNIDEKTTVEQGRTFKAFDGMAGGRAKLNHNAVERDPAKGRLGAIPPESWKTTVEGQEKDAIQSGFEGTLARTLDRMDAEAAKQKQGRDAVAGDFGDFRDRSKAFAKNMGMHADRANADLNEFDRDEAGAEQALRNEATARMRGRVSERLAASDPDYRAHQARSTRLGDLREHVAIPTLEAANSIDEDLAAAVKALESEASYRKTAADKTAEAARLEDKAANETDVAKKAEYEKGAREARLAASGAKDEADQAAQKATKKLGSAHGGIKALEPSLEALYRNETVRRDGMRTLVPGGLSDKTWDGRIVFFAITLPRLSVAASNASSLEDAKGVQGTFRAEILTPLRTFEAKVGEEVGVEKKALDKAVDDSIARQKEQAPKSW